MYEHTDYFGTEVIQFAIAARHDHLSIRAESRVRVDEPARAAQSGLGGAREARLRGARRRVPRPARPARQPGAHRRAARGGAGRHAAGDARADLQPDPRPLRIPAGRHLRRLDGQRPARRRRRGLPGLRPPGADDAAARRASPAATSPATCSRRTATAPHRPRSTPTPGSRRCCPDPTASRAGSAPTRPTAASTGAEHVKIGHGRAYSDVPPIRGVYRGGARPPPRGERADDPDRRRLSAGRLGASSRRRAAAVTSLGARASHRDRPDQALRRRQAAALGCPARRPTARCWPAAMAADVLERLDACTAIERTIVVSGEPEVAALAARAGRRPGRGRRRCRPLRGRPDRHRRGAGRRRRARRAAARRLPAAGRAPSSTRRSPRCSRASVGVIPDRHGAGTNGLLLSPPDAIEPSFGPGSRERHLQLAARGRRRGPRSPRSPRWASTSTPARTSRAALAAHRRRARRAPRDRPRRWPRSPAEPCGSTAGWRVPGELHRGRGPRRVRARRRPSGRRSRRAARARRDGDIVVISQKIVSKAEGRRARPRPRRARPARGRARRRARQGPRAGRARARREPCASSGPQRGVLITETHSGLICANAGIDSSNVPGERHVALLPADPDASARRIRAEIRGRRGRRPGGAHQPTASAGRGGSARPRSRSAAPGSSRSTTGAGAATATAASSRRPRSRPPISSPRAADLLRDKDAGDAGRARARPGAAW